MQSELGALLARQKEALARTERPKVGRRGPLEAGLNGRSQP